MYKFLTPVLFFVGLATAAAIQPQVANASNTNNSTQAEYCSNPAQGVLRDQFGGTDQFLTTYHMNKVTIKNTSSNCIYKVGIASYKAYEHYTVNVFSQTYFASKTYDLKPGETWTHTIPVPQCTYQTDVYWGNTLKEFTRPNGTYSGQGRLLDAWYFPGTNEQKDDLPVCVKHTPTPSPTPTPTPTVTPTPTPSPSPTPTPKVTPTPTPTPKVTPTPCPSGTMRDGDKCGEVAAAAATPTPTPEPPTELPSTGPGVAVVVSLLGMVGGLIGKKYYQG